MHKLPHKTLFGLSFLGPHEGLLRALDEPVKSPFPQVEMLMWPKFTG
jgi:hypothetical protein